ncbi:hypothetical protein A9261_21520 [Vibrio tasmaniensis]|nr:hypothetical protein A9261_21520 [Vibrio tasmaniensis]
MSKLSTKIKKQAKSLRLHDKSLKLTDYQNQLAIENGYTSFKALLKIEKTFETETKKTFALKSNSSSYFVYPSVGSGVEVFIRNDGLRGLRATRNFKVNETILVDELLIGYNISKIPLAEKSGTWGMVLPLLLPSSTGIIEHIIKRYNLRDSQRPKFNEYDKEIVDSLSKNLKHKPEYIRYIHAIVTTYHSTYIVLNPKKTISIFGYISAAMMYMNHSCDANAEVQPSIKANPSATDLISISDPIIIATKDIKQGDEITWTYDDEYTGLPLKARQKQLKTRFDFDCTCKRCYKEKFLIK